MTRRGNNNLPIGTKLRSRGRPRLFDADAALRGAEAAFLRNGYSATTLDDLSTRMGVNRPSLYAAFTSKEVLYQKALALYAQRMGSEFERALSEPVFTKALHKLYQTALNAYVSDDGEAVGCMVACTAVAEATSNPQLLAQTRCILDDIDALVARRVEQAKAVGDLPPHVKPRALSRLIVGVLHTLALRTRAGTSRRILDEVASDAAAMLASTASR